MSTRHDASLCRLEQRGPTQRIPLHEYHARDSPKVLHGRLGQSGCGLDHSHTQGSCEQCGQTLWLHLAQRIRSLQHVGILSLPEHRVMLPRCPAATMCSCSHTDSWLGAPRSLGQRVAH